MLIDDYAVSIFLVFCRIAACLMLIPGFSTARVPMRVRLFLAVALAAAIAPLIDTVERRGQQTPHELLAVITNETVSGSLIGLTSRLLMEAIEFSATSIGHYIGLASPAPAWDGGEAQPAVTSVVSLLALMILMALEFPGQVVAALIHSYASMPIGVLPEKAAILRHVVDTLGSALLLGVHLSAPFLIYGLVVNLIFGILGKVVPQVNSFFLSGPFIAFGGLLLMYLAITDMAYVLSRMLESVIPKF